MLLNIRRFRTGRPYHGGTPVPSRRPDRRPRLGTKGAQCECDHYGSSRKSELLASLVCEALGGQAGNDRQPLSSQATRRHCAGRSPGRGLRLQPGLRALVAPS
jgi:hypothetical protein